MEREGRGREGRVERLRGASVERRSNAVGHTSPLGPHPYLVFIDDEGVHGIVPATVEGLEWDGERESRKKGSVSRRRRRGSGERGRRHGVFLFGTCRRTAGVHRPPSSPPSLSPATLASRWAALTRATRPFQRGAPRHFNTTVPVRRRRRPSIPCGSLSSALSPSNRIPPS